MPEKINLLFVNIPNNLISASIAVLRQSGIEPNYDSTDSKNELQQLLDNEHCWDLLVVSEKNTDEGFPALKHITGHSKKIPLVFISNTELNSTYMAAMKEGASDCICKDHLERLPAIINREVKRKRKADTLANAVHELRTNLNSIILSNKLLIKADKGNFKKQVKFTNAIHHSSTHLLQYIDEFLDPVNNAKPHESTIDIRAFCQDLLHVFLSTAKKNNIHFYTDISDHILATVKTNAVYLERILTNLLSNAFKYTTKGKVSLTIYSPDEYEFFQEDERKDLIAFEVKDTGIGIPADEVGCIFNRHYRTNQPGTQECEGSGIGLDICRKLTNLLGGRLKVDSTLGEGTTFTLYLPVRVPPENKIEKKNYPSRPLEKTILIVDDNKLHNMAVKEFLDYEFSHCITATSAKEASHLIGNKSVDCLVLDLALSDVNGLQTVIHLKDKAKYYGIPIIVYTGKSLNTDERNTLNKYVDAIVQKKIYSYDTLVHTIYSIVNIKPTVKNSLLQRVLQN